MTQIFYVIVQNVEQPAFAQILSPSSLTHDYFTLCSCADDTNKAINNILSLLNSEYLDKLKLFRHCSSDLCLLPCISSLSINHYIQRKKLILIGPS